MKVVGYIALAVGILVAVCALFMNVSVPTVGGMRVNNIGLMEQRQTWLIFGGFVALAGLLAALLGDKFSSPSTAKCPFCAEKVNVEAIKCKHCGSDITATSTGSINTATDQNNSESSRLDGIGGDAKYIVAALIIMAGFIVFLLIY